ncbi:MAG: Mut7-C RNAse domain-containing protein, partial [Candidatus Poribacteria bacterium]|nr:Mut7-C RNAse domain-containing protein [Candidatus Poribacteria bacterium]
MADVPGPKFLADENVAKLGKWLRILGYDVAYQSPATDTQLALKALREDRVILTRDRGFSRRRIVEHCLLLTTQDPIEQFKQVIQAFNLKLNRNSFFTRCLDCNTLIQPVPKEKVQSAVPAYVYR